MRFLCAVLAFALAACGRADATETNRPTLAVEYLQGDSARVIARWSQPCDAKGCAESYRVQWRVRAITLTQDTRALADTLPLALPAIGDSLVVDVAVTSIRRTLPGPARTARAIVRNPDAPPPPVDSLRADTLALAERAERADLDSFPVIAIRDTLGRSSGSFSIDGGTVLCGLARNRYTGAVRLYVPADAPPEADAYLETVCERARQSYAAERAG